MKRKERRASIPRRAAETRASLIEHAFTPQHLSMIDAMVQQSRSYSSNLFDPRWTHRDVTARMADTAEKAALFAVTPEMWELVELAAETMPDETILPQDIPARTGWLYLDEPVRMIDVSGVEYEVRAIMWNEEVLGHDGVSPGLGSRGEKLPSTASGLVIYEFVSNSDLPIAGASGAFMRGIPELGLLGMITASYGRITWELDIENNTHSREFLMKHWKSMHDGKTIRDLGNHRAVVRTASGVELHVRHSRLMVLLKAFFAILRTELITESREYPPKGTTRSLPVPLRDREITVVDLRRVARDSPVTGGGHSMTVRTIRRGHWRRVWCGTGESKYQRWTFIYPYVAGPEGAPWSKSTVVNVLRR